MYRQINITLPDETLQLIDQIILKNQSSEATLRDISQFIDEAVKYYINNQTLEKLKEQLKQGAINRAERDLKLAEEWFDLEEEVCQINQP
ncbi:MAG TPA: hypothetical protein VK203_16665 [Nostocaceae cyanobacterium]|nr:hypothetical protein [Nostocaceae cyanobacterium]